MDCLKGIIYYDALDFLWAQSNTRYVECGNFYIHLGGHHEHF